MMTRAVVVRDSRTSQRQTWGAGTSCFCGPRECPPRLGNASSSPPPQRAQRRARTTGRGSGSALPRNKLRSVVHRSRSATGPVQRIPGAFDRILSTQVDSTKNETLILTTEGGQANPVFFLQKSFHSFGDGSSREAGQYVRVTDEGVTADARGRPWGPCGGTCPTPGQNNGDFIPWHALSAYSRDTAPRFWR